MQEKLSVDSTSSVKGHVYQYYLAIEQCCNLVEGQSVWIEKFGDITISDHAQIEVKHVEEDLNDKNKSFWNTLKNWLSSDFDHKKYKDLILITTQKFSPRSTLKDWNILKLEERSSLLHEIANTANIKKSNMDFYQSILINTPEDRLKEVLSKIMISTNNPESTYIKKRILDIHAKHIFDKKKDSFFDGLLGFILRDDVIESCWEITYKDFRVKYSNLSKDYSRDTIFFPKISEKSLKEIEEDEDFHQKLFVEKIHEIEHDDDVVAQAISEYLFTYLIIKEELDSYEIDHFFLDNYMYEHKNIYKVEYRKARRSVGASKINSSKDFYDSFMSSSVRPFYSFVSTPIDFRNGLLHLIADDENEDLVWRLW